MAITPSHIVVTVTTAGTRARVTTDTNIKPASVYFESVAGTVFIGLVTVSSTVYMAKLIPGASFRLEAPNVGGMNYRAGGQGIQLSDIYIDAGANGNVCQVSYVYGTGG